MRSGVRLALDVGRVRVGVASCDREGLLATPVTTLQRGSGDLDALRVLVGEYEPVEILVGLPLALSGADTPSTADARSYAATVASMFPVAVRLVDERMSTVSAQRGLHQAGRSTKSSRAVVDQAAAVIILQSALDAERGSGRPPGTLVDARKGA